MQLWVHGDAAYLIAKKSRSQIAGYFFLSNTPENPLQLKPTHNAYVHIECRLLKHVVASAIEVECGALFHNSQLAVPIKIILDELGNKQLNMPLITDNTTATILPNKEMKKKLSKSWDMRYH